MNRFKPTVVTYSTKPGNAQRSLMLEPNGRIPLPLRLLLVASVALIVHWTARVDRSNQTNDAVNCLKLKTLIQKVAPDWLIAFDGQPDRFVDTFPAGQDSIGFSGSSRLLLRLDQNQKLSDFRLVSSGDTSDHIAAVMSNRPFRGQLIGKRPQEIQAAVDQAEMDGVSGATLTSLSVLDGIARTFSQTMDNASRDELVPSVLSLKFPRQIQLSDVIPFFPAADQLLPLEAEVNLFRVQQGSDLLGFVARTAGIADELVGYGGPTDTLLALDDDKNCLGLTILSSFDNQPYIAYVTDDTYFCHDLFKGMNLEQLADLEDDPEDMEGVSGATMTSQNVATGIGRLSKRLLQVPNWTGTAKAVNKNLNLSPVEFYPTAIASKLLSNYALLFAVGCCFLVAIEGRLRQVLGVRLKKPLRILVISVTLVTLGILSNQLLTTRLLVGWAIHGFTSLNGLGLILIFGFSIVSLLFSKKNVYCQRICPMGSAQQLVQLLPKSAERNLTVPSETDRPTSTVKPSGVWYPSATAYFENGSKTIRRHLRQVSPWAPAVLFLLMLVSHSQEWTWNFIDMEAFAGFSGSVASSAAVMVLAILLAVSYFLPMFYCRNLCVVGWILNLFKR